MPVVTYEVIVNNLENSIKGVYFIYGDEDYFINKITDEVKNKYKNKLTTYFGDDCDIKNIFNDMYQQSIFDDFNVALIKNTEANKFINDKKNEDYIKSYIKNFTANAILIFIHSKNIPKNSNILTAFENSFTYNSKKLVNYQVKLFIKNYCKEKNIIIDNELIDKLYDYYDNNLSLIKDVIDNGNFNQISYIKDLNLFEFLNYISSLKRNKLIIATNNITNSNKNDLIPLLGMISNFFLKLLSYLDSNNKHSYQISYQNASFLFKKEDILEILKKLSYSDCCLKGIKSNIFSNVNILKYLVCFIVSR